MNEQTENCIATWLRFSPNTVDLLLIILGERYLLVCCSFCFVKRRNNHYSVDVINTSWKPSNENSETRCDKTEYILHCCCTSLVQVRDSLRQTERHSQERKKWWQFAILLERQEFIRATHFTSADLFLGCSSERVSSTIYFRWQLYC